MARYTFRKCRVCDDLHEVNAWPLACAAHYGEAPRQATYIRADGMDPIRSMVSGKIHDSRSAYYREVRQAGCEIVGNDRAGFGPRPQARSEGVAQSIKRALAQHGMGD
jgi:hypothetical protein